MFAVAAFGFAGCLPTAHANGEAQAGLPGFELVVAIDPIQRPDSPNVEIVPASVKQVWSYYQDQDLWLQGKQRLRRADGSSRGVSNQRVPLPGFVSAHARIVGPLILGQPVGQQKISDTFR